VTPEARAARERKQKIFVVVGGLFLLAMLAFQVPKLLGGSSSPAAAPATTTEATTAAPGQPVTPSGATSVALVPASTGTKITSFSVFAAKDPFVQQVVTEAPAAEGDGKAAAASGSPGKSKTPAQTFSTGKGGAAAATIVTVNGVRHVLEPGQKFPASDPLFVLVAEKPGSKSVVVGIAGGAYSGGRRTTTLKSGKPLTLVNTATGARYKISLVSVGSGGEEAVPAPKP
jgi:hypothetical protein